MLLICAAAAALLILLCFPALCISGAAKGLCLWYQQIIPALLPAMLLTSWTIRRPAVQTLLHKLPSASFTAFLIGLICGCPMGARACHELRQAQLLSDKKAFWLCTLVQMPSPAFILGFTAKACLQLDQPLLFAAAFYLPGATSCLIFFFLDSRSKTGFCSAIPASFDDVCHDCLLILVKIGILLMYVTIINELLLSAFSGSSFLVLLTGLLEMTTGILQTCNLPLPSHLMAALCLFFLNFGGICVHLQVRQVWTGKFYFARYIGTRLVFGILSSFLYLFFLHAK